MKKTLAIIVVVILVLAGGLAVSYNGLAGDRESVDTAQADVETMLQRRADLIPNLVSTVKSMRNMRRKFLTRFWKPAAS